MGGPLAGVRVVEMAGIGPAPYATMMLADLGADVIRIDRPDGQPMLPQGGPADVLGRGKRSIALDLKDSAGLTTARQLIDTADALVDPYRPGVLERIGLAPDECLERNPRLVFARMTGWGQTGPLAQAAGHDINYIALAGALYAMGRPDEPPPVPLNLVGDFGGGGMLLAFGIVAALFERVQSGRGQVVDVAMVDGVASLLASICGLDALGQWSHERGRNWLDGAAPWYRPYRSADGQWVTIGALEPQFYDGLLRRLGVDPSAWPQWDDNRWPQLHRRLETIFAGRTAAEWRELLEGTDACFAPVLRLDQAKHHPHIAARETYVVRNRVVQPAPAPRFTRTPGAIGGPAPRVGQHTAEVSAELNGNRTPEPNFIANQKG
jgi:alpha-methylacyl-CoA racemase